MIPGLQDAIDRNRAELETWVDARRDDVQIPVQTGEVMDEVIFTIVRLTRRRYALPAPWAIREYMYRVNVLVHDSDPETPLVFGEWKHWYRYPSWAQPEIPPHEDKSWRLR